MEDKVLKKYKDAGSIAKKVRVWSKSLVKSGAKILDIADEIEAKILAEAEIAFPTNICINDVTAHYTPKFDDETVLTDNDLVSIDLGVHVDGYIADTAYTIDLSGNYADMIAANQKALDAAIALVKPGLSVSVIGARVQNILADSGFKPIENLTGHEVQQYDLHAGLHVPNIKVSYDQKIEEDMVIALEPFATDGCGRVVESKQAEIFSQINIKPIRLREARILLKKIKSREELPFAGRWYAKELNPMKMNLALRDLVSKEILRAYPTLHERDAGSVSQFEHTLIVTSTGCEVIT